MKWIYRLFKKLIGIFGYNLYIMRSGDGESEYETTTPLATYAPWKSDIEFLSIYAKMKNYTLVDLYRCYELWTLVEQVKDVNGIFLEVGVWRGGTAAIISSAIQKNNLDSIVYLCDTFEGVVKASLKDGSYSDGEHSDTSVETVTNLLKGFGLNNFKILKGIFPEQTSAEIEKANIRYCHIDVDVYQSAKDILDFVWDRMCKGGIVIFDDYGFYGCEGVTKLVNEWINRNDLVFIHNLNGHGLFIKK